MTTCTSNKEWKILKGNYSDLISTITEIDKLLPHFVQNNVIGYPEEEEILAEKNQQNKVTKLLRHISGPLEVGNTTGFYKLLKIMKSKGNQSTQDLAHDMEKSLNN